MEDALQDDKGRNNGRGNREKENRDRPAATKENGEQLLTARSLVVESLAIEAKGESKELNRLNGGLRARSQPLESWNDVVNIYLQQAQAYSDKKQWDKAIRACEEALQVAPETADAYKLLGNILQQQGNVIEAMGAYAKALALQPHFPEIYSNLGSLYAHQQNWDMAIAYYQKALEKDDRFAPAHINLAKLWNKLNNPEKETHHLAIALKLQPDLGEAKEHYRIGQLLETDGKIEDAIDFYRQAIAQDDSFVQSYQRLADLLEDQGDWQEAVVCYRKVLDLTGEVKPLHSPANSRTQREIIQPTHQSSHSATNGKVNRSTNQGNGQSNSQSNGQNSRRQNSSSNSLSNTQRNSRAIVSSALAPPKTSFALSPDDQRFINQLVRVSSQKKLLRPLAISGSKSTRSKSTGSKSTAPKSTSRQIASSSVVQLPHAAVPVAQPLAFSPSFSAQAQQPAAKVQPLTIKQFQQAIQQSPRSAELYRGLAQAFMKNKQQPEAAKALYRSFLLEPSWPTAKQCLNVGSVLAQNNEVKAATHCYQQAIYLQPQMAIAYEQLAQLLRSQNQLVEAEAVLNQFARSNLKKTFKKATRSEHNASEHKATDTRSIALASAPKKSSVSIAAQERAIETHNQGETLRKQGQWENAIAAYQQAIALNPEFSWAHHSLGDCYKKLGSWDEAAAAYRQAIALEADFVWSYYSLAEVCERLEHWEDAQKNYQQVLAIDANNEQVPPRLVSVLQQLRQRSPHDIKYYIELAEQLAIQGKTDEAIATYQMALQIQPNDSNIALALSKMLTYKDPQQAHALLDRALSKTVVNSAVDSPNELSNPQRVAALLQHTHLFDPVYYRATNPDVAAADDDALLLHYIQQGSAAGRNPNPLFDDSFYRVQHPDVAEQNLNPLAHYHYFGYKAGYDPHPFFKAAFYCKLHADVAAADINPLDHYLTYGAKEGRAAFGADQFTSLLNNPVPADAHYLQAWKAAAANAVASRQNLGVYCNSMGNYFITEIADFIADALTQAGHTVTRLSEKDTPPEHLDGHWIVAPHEFFYLGEGAQWAQKWAQRWTQKQTWLARAVMVNVEQPQTTWFSKAFHFLRHARIIFDINVKSAAIMQCLGLPAYWLPFGYLPDYAPFTAQPTLPNLLALRSLSPEISQQIPSLEAPLRDRPLDIHFIGTLNPRRETFFAQSAVWLSQHRCFLHIPPMGTPLLKGQDQALDTAAVIGLSRRSKILLNIHRDELPYFEWHRIIFHGLWQNTLVVSEPCHDIPGLVAGEHFIECSLADMPSTIEWLLHTPDGQATAERIRHAGHQALRSQFNGSDIMTQALHLIQATAGGNPSC
jgi:tetratricopeptide (TPR) repeat protein